MKIIAINGSPNAKGNTALALDLVCSSLVEEGIETEVIQVGNMALHGCTACGACGRNKDGRCALPDDGLNAIVARMREADGIVIGSPVYFSGIAGTMKCFLDRSFYVSASNGGLFRHKVGAALVALRRSGGVASFDQLNHYLLYAEMLLAGSTYWNVIHGAKAGEAAGDEEGTQVMRVLGSKLAWLLKTVQAGKAAGIEAPAPVVKVRTNFIR
jgi:multimeric flavodoxin WrbA